MSGDLLSFQQRRDWLRLIKSENVGPVTFFKLINRYGGARQALRALPELSQRGGMKRPIRICSQEDAERDLQAADDIGASVIAFGEPDYPALLRQTDGAPPLICAKGNLSLLNEKSIALVGSRNASAVGQKFAGTLAREFGQAGYITVSGLARGIDTNAHVASLDSGTIAVVAGGIDVIYPPENQELHHKIFETGVVVSEMMPGVRPQARHFPRRNRLISGISLGTVVIEAALRSGSLITARLAAEQNREVFAVPGSPLDPRAGGANKLIQNGATLVAKAQDVIEAIESLSSHQTGQIDFFKDIELPDENTLSPDLPDQDIKQKVTTLLSPAPVHIDDLARQADTNVQMVHSILIELELAGRLERHTGQRVSII